LKDTRLALDCACVVGDSDSLAAGQRAYLRRLRSGFAADDAAILRIRAARKSGIPATGFFLHFRHHLCGWISQALTVCRPITHLILGPEVTKTGVSSPRIQSGATVSGYRKWPENLTFKKVQNDNTFFALASTGLQKILGARWYEAKASALNGIESVRTAIQMTVALIAWRLKTDRRIFAWARQRPDCQRDVSLSGFVP
jgi:hypothetical protein